MAFFDVLLNKLRATFAGTRGDAELNEEIASHLAMLTRANIERGMPLREAELAAKREFGGVEATKQIYREQRGINFIENLLQDLRLAMRSLRKNPGFAAIAIGSLAVGIGASTSMFSIVRELKFRALPVPRPEELVQIRSYAPEFKSYADTFSYPFVDELAKAKLFRSAAATFPITVSLYDGIKTSQVASELVTAQYFPTLEVEPALGRLLTAEDMNAPGGNWVCVISHALWQSHFAGRNDVLAQSIQVNGHPFQIVGVTGPHFRGSVLYWPHDLEIPISMTGVFMHDFPWHSANATFLYPFARLERGMDRERAEKAFKLLGPRIGAIIRNPKDPDQTARFNRFSLAPASQGPTFMEDRGTQTALVSGIVVLTLLLACANIACLLLARASAQERETAVQLSLGAPRARIMQRHFVESLMLTAAGGLLGLLASHWLIPVFLYVLNISYLPVKLNGGMLLFSLAAGAFTALLFGVFPGWQSCRVSARSLGLREHGAARPNRQQTFFRKGLVAFQIALATVLLIACTLFLRSLEKAQAVELGFDPKNVLITDLDPGRAGRSTAQSLEIYRTVLERVRRLPNIESATLAFGVPLGGFLQQASFDPAKMTTAKVPRRLVTALSAGADYFRTLRIPLLSGRDFDARDFGKFRSVIVNRAFVDYYQLGNKALGHHFQFDGDTEIVGVVANSKYQSIREAPSPAMFFPVTDGLKGQLSIVARARQESDATFRDISTIVQSVDPRTPIVEEKRLSELVEKQSFDQRALAALCSLFSLFALALGCMGLYGVAAYSIARRTQEIGVRFALGARRSNVAKLFLRESLLLIAAGLAGGIPVALGLATLVKAALFAVEPADPLTLAAAAAILALACIAASILPLGRAFAVNPVDALRAE